MDNLETQFIPWGKLKNPVYSHADWSTKDACMLYKDGVFYLFFSAFYFDRGRERSHVVGVTTKDWLNFSEPFLHIDGHEDDWTGMCSPDIAVVILDGTTDYYLTFNSWGDTHPNGKKNQLFYIKSHDLVNWSHYRQIGQNLTEKLRCIDISIAYMNNLFHIMWKDESSFIPRKGYRSRIATAKDLEGDWQFIDHGICSFYLSKGRFKKTEKKSFHTQENYQLLTIDGTPYLVTTAYAPNHPMIYQIGGPSDRDENWLIWKNGYCPAIPKEKFNTNHRANSPFIADWRQYDGYFYILYAGRTHGRNHAGRGDNKLGLCRSKDLNHWEFPH